MLSREICILKLKNVKILLFLACSNVWQLLGLPRLHKSYLHEISEHLLSNLRTQGQSWTFFMMMYTLKEVRLSLKLILSYAKSTDTQYITRHTEF